MGDGDRLQVKLNPERSGGAPVIFANHMEALGDFGGFAVLNFFAGLPREIPKGLIDGSSDETHAPIELSAPLVAQLVVPSAAWHNLITTLADQVQTDEVKEDGAQ